jgi:multicomponent Na+:H+ antiporter subunit G
VSTAADVGAVLADVTSAGLILLGSAFTLISAIGLHRMPDTLRRLHVATKPATFAVACTFIGTALRLPSLPDVTKLLVALVLQFVTAPVAAHLLGTASVLEEDPDASAPHPDRDHNPAGPPGDGGSSPTTSST